MPIFLLQYDCKFQPIKPLFPRVIILFSSYILIPMNKLFAAFYILFNVFLSIALIWIFAELEPTINRQFFPNLPEAEIQSYVIGLGFFFLFQFAGFRFIPTQHIALTRISSLFIGVTLWLIIILILVGTYKFFMNIEHSEKLQYTLSSLGFSTIKSLDVIGALFSVGIFIAIVFFIFPKIHRKKHWTYAMHVFSCSILFLLVIGIPKLNLYDYTHYAGPIHDILIGNTPLTSRTWYGFFPIVLLSILFRFIPLSAASLHIAITIIHYLGFLLFYKLLSKILHDARWALIGTLYAIFGSHLVMIGGINEHPQNTFIRTGAWLIVAYTIAYRSVLVKKLGKIATAFPSIIVALSLFWTLDFGLYTLGAYCLFLYSTNLNDHINTFVKHLSRSLVVVAGCLIATFGLINFVYIILFHRLPMWFTHYFFVTNYQLSNHMLPVPNEPWLWISVLIPVATISFLLFQMKQKKGLNDEQSAVLFIAMASLTNFSYFLGRTTLNQLHNISLPIIVCAFYLIKIIFDQARKSSRSNAIASIVLIGTIIGVPGTLLAHESVQYLVIANPVNTLSIVRGEMFNEYDWFGPTTKVMLSKYGDEIKAGNFTLLSMWDTWYLILLHTTNRVGINCQLCYIPDENVDFQANNILNSPSRYLFLDAQRSQYEYGARVDEVFLMVRSKYHYVETVGLLDVYKRI